MSGRPPKPTDPPRGLVDPVQFDLGLDVLPVRHIKIAVMDAIHGSRLSRLVAETAPEIVLDLREVLRFDAPGLTRDSFFRALSSAGATYARSPIGWAGTKATPMAAKALPVRLHHEAVERWGGNLVLLVSLPMQAAQVHAMLNLALSVARPAGWSIERVS